MGLCSPRSCGCAIQSDSLSITGSGTPEDPLQIEFGLPLPADLLETIMPAGTIRATPYATADAGWLLFGATYTNANVAYPTLWGKVPSGWKSGTSLVLPTDAEMVLRGKASSLGSVSGSNTRTLTTTELPAHTHTINHGHTGSGSSGNVSADHNHTFSGTTGGQSNTHSHGMKGPSAYSPGAGIGYTPLDWATYPAEPLGAYTGHNVEDHTHGYSGTTSGISANHNHAISVTVDSHSGSSGSAGSGSAFNIQEAGINVRFQIKAH